MKTARPAAIVIAVAGLCLCAGSRLAAQDARDSLIRRAFGETDPTSRLWMLVTALNPAAGPTGEVWSSGVQLLAQTLLEQGRDSVAAAWLRWAIRLRPELQADTLQFPPPLTAAVERARDFVVRTAVPEDSLVASSWTWPERPVLDALGRLHTGAGIELVAAGAGLDLAPGSYRIVVSRAEGPSAALTREVLPGITTVVEIRPQAVARVPVPEPAPPPEPGVSPRRRIPWKWAAVGAVGLGLVALLAGGGDEKPRTGGIIITLPAP
jgi:hypothetical protein